MGKRINSRVKNSREGKNPSRGPTPKRKKVDKYVTYLVWLDWQHPVTGFSYPPGNDLPHGYHERPHGFLNISHVTHHGPNGWACIGEATDPHRIRFVHRDEANAVAQAIGGYIEKEEGERRAGGEKTPPAGPPRRENNRKRL
jgi:hypothetical protein